MAVTMDPEVVGNISLDEGDHERCSHIIRKQDQMAGYVGGQPITALCGRVWVPYRDPKKFPICPTCKEIWESATGRVWQR